MNLLKWFIKMLRDLIAWVLNNYLGRYVENLNTTQLTVALLSGNQNIRKSPKKDPAMSHFNSQFIEFTVIFCLLRYCNIAIHSTTLKARFKWRFVLQLKFHFSWKLFLSSRWCNRPKNRKNVQNENKQQQKKSETFKTKTHFLFSIARPPSCMCWVMIISVN